MPKEKGKPKTKSTSSSAFFTKISTEDLRRVPLADLIRTKGSIPITELKKTGDGGGVSEAYKAEDAEYSQKGKGVIVKATSNVMSVRGTNDRDGPVEFIVSGLYKRLLHGRVSNYGIVKSNDNKVMIHSHFLENFRSLSDLSIEERKKVRGMAKIITACVAGAEGDNHAKNLGAVPDTDGDLVAVKIDHGRSAYFLCNTTAEMCASFIRNFDVHKYDQEFTLEKSAFAEAIKEVSTVSDKELETLIGSKIYQLEKAGFNFASLNYGHTVLRGEERQNPTLAQIVETNKLNYQETKDKRAFFINAYKKQFELMRTLDRNIEVMRKFQIKDSVSGQVQNPTNTISLREWFNCAADPLLFATQKKWLIDGQRPFAYAVSTNNTELIDISARNGFTFSLKDYEQIKCNELLLIAAKNNHQSAIKWLLKQGADPNAKDTDGKTAIRYAVEKGNKELVEELLKQGADPNAKDKEGKTPIFYVSRGQDDNSIAIRELLFSKGAHVRDALSGDLLELKNDIKKIARRLYRLGSFGWASSKNKSKSQHRIR
ncbi:MAG: ankyrin repeat domain-containing protein [Rickettsiaceae bacterium]|nr:ankyrin repeat domain-containing protein [Rickettsiaceae bacterium]